MERRLWDVVLPNVFFAAGDNYAEHSVFERVSTDDVLPNKFFLSGRTFRGIWMMGCGAKGQGSRRKGQRVKDKERGLWNVGCGTLFSRMFFVSGEHFAEHCAFEGVSPDDVLPKEFFGSGEHFVEQGRGLWDARARDRK